MKMAHSEKRKEPYNTLKSTEQNNIQQELSKKNGHIKGKRTKQNTKEPYKIAIKNKNKNKKQSIRTDSLVEEDLSKVPKRSSQRKQSH